ncbi:Flp/Fap pilin component [Mesorhizobium sp. ORS 3359]|nr:Flp/Fap pilin component [Mesorhizobium sp. ORS 3359]
MKKLMTMARQFRDDDNGAAMVEYSILIGIITAAVITMIIAVGVYVTNSWTTLCSNLENNGPSGLTTGMNCAGAG